MMLAQKFLALVVVKFVKKEFVKNVLETLIIGILKLVYVKKGFKKTLNKNVSLFYVHKNVKFVYLEFVRLVLTTKKIKIVKVVSVCKDIIYKKNNVFMIAKQKLHINF